MTQCSSDEQSFEHRTMPEPMSGCLIWLGALAKSGYGVMWDRKYRKVRTAHRHAWEREHGPILNNAHILHKCDNRTCCNVDHLFIGTNQDNIDDMDAKGRRRAARGIDHGKAILTEDDVRAIRSDNRTFKAIAADYGVAIPTIGSIMTRKNWKHVT